MTNQVENNPYSATQQPGVLNYAAPTVTGPVGIGGWLILPAIGLVLSPVVLVISIIRGLADVPKMPAGVQGAVVVNTLTSIVLIAMIIFAAQAFFTKQRRTPWAMTILYAGNVVLSIIDVIAYALFLGTELEILLEGSLGVVRAVVVAAVWIPYFRVSKRVANTFVN